MLTTPGAQRSPGYSASSLSPPPSNPCFSEYPSSPSLHRPPLHPSLHPTPDCKRRELKGEENGGCSERKRGMECGARGWERDCRVCLWVRKHVHESQWAASAEQWQEGLGRRNTAHGGLMRIYLEGFAEKKVRWGQIWGDGGRVELREKQRDQSDQRGWILVWEQAAGRGCKTGGKEGKDMKKKLREMEWEKKRKKAEIPSQ